MLIITAITGSPSLGIAVSVLRRTRQIIWTVFSLIIGWLYFSKTRLVYADDLES